MIRVLKIGGNQLDDPIFICGIAQAIKHMSDLPIVVHGGSKSIKALQRKLGIKSQSIDGQPMTVPSPLEIIMMVLCGQLNLKLVAALTNVGIEAQGFTGADRGLIRAKPVLRPDGSIGRVGEVTSVRTDILLNTLSANIVPVITPVLLGEDGRFFSNNADQIASIIGIAVKAEQIIFLTDVPGVLNRGTLVEHITPQQARELIVNGTVTGGMVVKLNAALDSILSGVQQAVITDLQGLVQGTGTVASSQG